MNFLKQENLDDSGQFILARDFFRSFVVTIYNKIVLTRKYVERQINRIKTDQNKVPIFLDRKVKVQSRQAAVAVFTMSNLN